ncbi:toll/interleukin-1 receptor domain-containing protein [Streptomyces sp. NBC_01190]|uniref:toll/interleukin-1 receptor domain-containing protein n=1 Tax=Streptomyces sp. NBC_01190 TaxID=2903767 RepID=UPI00386439E8|nr:toll/interleukin-1 receptor domain-containing protein [Streptomyces sp. NBC_01190]
MTGAFINYRTGDGEKEAALLDEVLRQEFGNKRVFRDQRALEPGEDFPAKLWQRLRESNVVLVLVGPNWLTARNEAGELKLLVKGDYVHDEIAAALQQSPTRVITILLNGTPHLVAAQLPPEIKKLADRQVMYLRTPLAHLDLPLVVKEVRKYLPPAGGKRAKDRGPGRGPNGGTSLTGIKGSAVVIGNGNATNGKN